MDLTHTHHSENIHLSTILSSFIFLDLYTHLIVKSINTHTYFPFAQIWFTFIIRNNKYTLYYPFLRFFERKFSLVPLSWAEKAFVLMIAIGWCYYLFGVLLEPSDQYSWFLSIWAETHIFTSASDMERS